MLVPFVYRTYCSCTHSSGARGQKHNYVLYVLLGLLLILHPPWHRLNPFYRTMISNSRDTRPSLWRRLSRFSRSKEHLGGTSAHRKGSSLDLEAHRIALLANLVPLGWNLYRSSVSRSAFVDVHCHLRGCSSPSTFW